MPGPQPPQQQQPRPHDCLGCRVTGGLFGLAGGAYLASHVFLAEKPMARGHKYATLAAAGAVLAAGMYRAFF